MEGVVKWYDPKRGIGFVTAEVNGEMTDNILIHFTELANLASLESGNKIAFELEYGNKGLNAKQIRLLDGNSPASNEAKGKPAGVSDLAGKKKRSFLVLNPFKVNKALKQAYRYIDEVNKINEEYHGMLSEQNQIIGEQNELIRKLKNEN